MTKINICNTLVYIKLLRKMSIPEGCRIYENFIGITGRSDEKMNLYFTGFCFWFPYNVISTPNVSGGGQKILP